MHGPGAVDTQTRARRASTEGPLHEIEARVLWLSTSIIHHANRIRTNTSGLKVGGHQASSASMVTIMTSLWFEQLRSADRVSVKPHASPVLHAINYLLGELDEKYLTTLREFGGLQSYPSRSKDPDPVDYSTGSVELVLPLRSGAPSPDATSRRSLARRDRVASTRWLVTLNWTRVRCGRRFWTARSQNWAKWCGSWT